MLIFLSSITSREEEEEEEEEEEGEVVSGGNGDLYGYHLHPPPARILSTDSSSRPAVTSAGSQRPFFCTKSLHFHDSERGVDLLTDVVFTLLR
ncbi:hypothetical protein PAMP_018205 [Pampus punctatissimus]